MTTLVDTSSDGGGGEGSEVGAGISDGRSVGTNKSGLCNTIRDGVP